MEYFTKKSEQFLDLVAKHSIIDVWQGSKYTSDISVYILSGPEYSRLVSFYLECFCHFVALVEKK